MQSTQEQWKPVVGYESMYEVSNLGRVRSLPRTTRIGQPVRGKVLTSRANGPGGHLKIGLRIYRARRNFFVHRLVLIAFEGDEPGKEVRHLNGVPTDNRLSNLKWGSRSENNLDTVAHGNHPQASKTHCPRGHAFVGANLMSWHLARGERKCRACENARKAARRRGEEFTKEAADAYFARYVPTGVGS